MSHVGGMPRSPRIEFEGAVYHVIARGNRREPIVFDDHDRKLFFDTFAEACEMTGWEVFAWVLLDNHYHAVFRTPHSNLVEGMKWLQNTYTRRLNCRHKLWGHLFGGRYRSILVENKDYGGAVWKDYFRTVVDYVHLNPGRAGLVDGKETLSIDYQWSSLSFGYGCAPSKRPPWMAATEVLDLFQERDTPKGRQSFIERIDHWIRDENGEPSVEAKSYKDRLTRGWYWGSESFKEVLLELLAPDSTGNRTYQSGPMMKDHSETHARRIIAAAQKHYQLTGEELKVQVRGDLTRASIAARIFYETTVSQQWIADQLGMKSAPNVCQQIRRYRNDESQLPLKVKRWKKVNIF